MTFTTYPPLDACGTSFKIYVSEKTGLRGMLMETGEPLCSLHVVIATESDTHDCTAVALELTLLALCTLHRVTSAPPPGSSA
jgi:hypothetical protein